MLSRLFSRIKGESGMAKVTINGVTYEGSNIRVNGNTVLIDGQSIGSNFTTPLEVHIVEGVLNELHADGSVRCNNVAGSVRAGGSVSCDRVDGNVSAGGSVSCDDVGGDIVAGGSVRRS